jgi:hypothetical protein
MLFLLLILQISYTETISSPSLKNGGLGQGRAISKAWRGDDGEGRELEEDWGSSRVGRGPMD